MFYTPPETDELGYSNRIQRWLGENLIRPAVGDDNLINASDAELFFGTAAFATIAAVTIVYTGPTIVSSVIAAQGAIAAFAGSSFLAYEVTQAATGAVISGILDVAMQLQAGTSWSRIDWGQAGVAALNGGCDRRGFRQGFKGLQLAATAITTRFAAACLPVTFGLKGMMAGMAVDGIKNGVEAWNNGDFVGGATSIAFGILGLKGALSLGTNCFTAGHQILALPLGVTVADVALGTSDETSGWRAEYLIGAGVAIAVGMTGSARERRKRRRLLAQARDHVYGFQWESNARHDFDDDNDPLREAIAMDHAEAAIWSDESFLPDAGSFDEPATASFASDAEQVHSVACLAPPQVAQFQSNAAPAKPSAARKANVKAKPPRESRRGGLWLGLSLVVAFFCLFQALPRWSQTDGLSSARTRHGVAPRLARHRTSPATTASAANPTQFFNIEDIRPDQLVLASNPATGQLEPRRVLQTFRRTTYHLRHLTFQSPTGARQTFETTDEHPFWSHGAARWTPAGDLQPGDRVIDPHGAQSLLVTTYREPHPEGVTVYNFEVEGFHSYFVAGKGPSGQPVLVHNTCRISPKTGRSRRCAPQRAAQGRTGGTMSSIRVSRLRRSTRACRASVPPALVRPSGNFLEQNRTAFRSSRASLAARRCVLPDLT